MCKIVRFPLGDIKQPSVLLRVFFDPKGSVWYGFFFYFHCGIVAIRRIICRHTKRIWEKKDFETAHSLPRPFERLYAVGWIVFETIRARNVITRGLPGHPGKKWRRTVFCCFVFLHCPSYLLSNDRIDRSCVPFGAFPSLAHGKHCAIRKWCDQKNKLTLNDFKSRPTSNEKRLHKRCIAWLDSVLTPLRIDCYPLGSARSRGFFVVLLYTN